WSSDVCSSDLDKLISRKICHGTNNFLKQDAMSEAKVEKALMIGSEEAGNVIANGAKALIVGEVGIGNTTSASALLAAILDVPVEELTGPGTGLNAEKIIHKQQIIKQRSEEHTSELQSRF